MCDVTKPVLDVHQWHGRKGKEGTRGIRWAGKELKILSFADDVVLMAEKEEGMDRMLSVANNYSKEWRFSSTRRSAR